MTAIATRPLFFLFLLICLSAGFSRGQSTPENRFPELEPKPPGTSRWNPEPQDQGDGQEDSNHSVPAEPNPVTWNPEPVAELIWQAGPRKEFVLHATLPVPDTFEFAPAGHSPIGIRPKGLESDPIPAQVHVVARDSKGNVQVIEVLAPIQMP
ncbi:MAG: hypothetical protein P1V35_15010, partial [Planctomycetota bacterium]|nr:hypothetical protein [Planctomycetota bacterium]